MGNCFGKTSDKSFQGEGRTLGASPAKVPPPTQSQGASAAVPRIAPPQGGRTLGKNSQDGSQAPGAAAAKAAEVRLVSSSTTLKKLSPRRITRTCQRLGCDSGKSWSWVHIQLPEPVTADYSDSSLHLRLPEANKLYSQERVKASQGKGKLGKQLDAQKSQSQTGTLAQTARDNVAARDADAAAQARNWN